MLLESGGPEIKATLHRWHESEKLVFYGTPQQHYTRASNELLIKNTILWKCIPSMIDLSYNQNHLFNIMKAEENYFHSMRYGNSLSFIKDVSSSLPCLLHLENRTEE